MLTPLPPMYRTLQHAQPGSLYIMVSCSVLDRENTNRVWEKAMHMTETARG